MCGCIAITYIMNAPIKLYTDANSVNAFIDPQNLVMGSIFIGLAAIFDVFDGLVARMMNTFSPIGKDLDSLADVVSFGVAPGMILYKMLWFAQSSQQNALDMNTLMLIPAFILPCFAALRLATFNQDVSGQKKYFKGMPSPASGIIVATLPLILEYDKNDFIRGLILNKWFLYGVVIILSYLMVSKIKFLKWKAPGTGIAAWWPQILIVLTIVLGSFIIGYSAILLGVIVYIICSMLYKYPNIETANSN